jgi:hypothetical protein
VRAGHYMVEVWCLARHLATLHPQSLQGSHQRLL